MKRYSTDSISFLSISVICILTIISSVFFIISMNRMQKTTFTIVDHPYTVSNNSWMIKNDISIMKIRVERLLSYHSSEDIQIVKDALHRRTMEIQPSVEVLQKRYLGPQTDVSNLLTHLEELKIRQQNVLAVAEAQPDGQAISAAINQHLTPLYQQLDKDFEEIQKFITQNAKQYAQDTKNIMRISNILVILFTACIFFIAVLFHVLILKKNKNILYKDKLFEIFSQNVDDVFCIYSMDKRAMEYVSPNAKRILGIAPGKINTLPDSILPYVHAEDKHELLAVFCSETFPHAAECECRILLPHTREERWMGIRVYPIKERRDTITHYIATLSDQTTAKQHQQVLKDALLDAQNANAAKRDFLSRMSHEIRTPMNAIIGMTTIAAAHMDSTPRVEDCLTKISASSKHLLMLINDILDMSAIENGKLHIAREPIHLAPFINNIVSIFYPQAEAKGVRFEVMLADLTDEIVLGDALRLNQVLINLLSNAIKFTPAGENVTLEVRQLRKAGSIAYMRFTVSDTGIGMEDTALAHIFLPFEQADRQIVRKYGGTGLGLAIVRSLVSLHGGSIDVRSAPGEGSTFSVELPLGVPEHTAAPLPSPELRELNVLVVDDDRDCCEHTTIILERIGVRATWALSGLDAVDEVVRAHGTEAAYDVCFIDWQMPGLDGVETTRRIRSHVGPDVLIIIISAYDWTVIEQEAREAGVSGFIAKPLFQSSLHDTLVSVCAGRPSMEKEAAKNFDFTGKRILLAEDNALNMEVALEILKNTGADVEGVVNGREALERFEASPSGHYDFILLDIQMPEMDGYETARAIRASTRPDAAGIPLVAMTANAFSEDISAALASGMNAHIAKPIDVTALYKTLQQHSKK